MDVRLILRQIEDSKGLVIEAIEALHPPKKNPEKMFDLAMARSPNPWRNLTRTARYYTEGVKFRPLGTNWIRPLV